MEMASTHAALVDSRDFADSVTATIPRTEFEAALASEEPAELFLEVKRPEDGDTSEADVGIAWSREDLERLLSETTGPSITLAFDRRELERILAEPDVEGHGLRERAAVLTVAVVAAAGGASMAAAAPEAGGITGGAVTPSEQVRGSDATGPPQGRSITPSYASVHNEATLAERGITPLAASAHDESSMEARGIAAEPLPASHDETTLEARGIAAEPLPAAHDETTLEARGIAAEPLPASHDETTLEARGIAAEPLPASHDETTLEARGIAPAAPATGAGDSGFAVDVPFEASTAAAVGGGLAGLGLLITAAGFAVRRQRSTRPA
jgi:hypothetical protein